MKIIQSGRMLKIYDDSMTVGDFIPAQTYVIRYDNHNGFYLQSVDDMEVFEKMYGSHVRKAEKVMNSFKEFERSLGVILSGDKGIGKSMFARHLSEQVIAAKMPVIRVDHYYPGIAAYIDDIKQECMVFFDEFDKVFASKDDFDPQNEMLPLFDGVSGGKKLFVITCNGYRTLNEFLMNRPGRFHNHLRFDYPTPEEVTEYLTENVNEAYIEEIPAVADFSRRVHLNYDCLRSIAFELNRGEKFKDAILDLNIVNTEKRSYSPVLRYKDGRELTHYVETIDFFQNQRQTFWMEDEHHGSYIVRVSFRPSDCRFDRTSGLYIIPAADLHLVYSEIEADDSKDFIERLTSFKAAEPEYLALLPVAEHNIGYVL